MARSRTSSGGSSGSRSSSRSSSTRSSSSRSSSSRSSSSRSRSGSSRRSSNGSAQLTKIETKLGEVIGLAMASQGAIDRVSKLVQDRTLAQQLETVKREAAEAEKSATEVAGSFQGKKSAILKEARETKQKATKMMTDYLGRGADALDGFEFLTMAEAGEVGHWTILQQMNKQAGHAGIRQLASKQVTIQRRHLKEAQQASLTLAGQEDPNEAA